MSNSVLLNQYIVQRVSAHCPKSAHLIHELQLQFKVSSSYVKNIQSIAVK